MSSHLIDIVIPLLMVLVGIGLFVLILYVGKEKYTEKRFGGKTVLITGGTSGIGLATALLFAGNGARVIVCGRHPEKWEKAGVKNDMIEYYKCDVTKEEEVRAMIEYIFNTYKHLDIAFNNAGIVTAPETIDKQDLKLENPLTTDGIGVFYCLKWEIHYMRSVTYAEPPCIVNTSSINAFWGTPGSLYGAGKSMVLLLTRSVAGEQSEAGGLSPSIRVNCIAPGAVNTPLLRNQIGNNPDEKEVNKIAGVGIPLKRVARPEEIGQAVMFLADNKTASYITGSCLVVDGGLTASPMF